MEEQTISLREYFESKLLAMKEALDLARDSMEKRLDGMNEFREALNDQARQFVTKSEYEHQNGTHDRTHASIVDDIRTLRDSRTSQDGKLSAIDKETSATASNLEKRLEGMNEFRSQLKEQAGTFITRTEHEALIAKFDSEVNDLKKFRDTQQGKADQVALTKTNSNVTVNTVISVIGVVLGLLAVALRFMGK